MHPMWDTPRLRAEYQAARAEADTTQELFKATLDDEGRRQLHQVMLAEENEAMTWLFLDKARLVDAIQAHFPGLPIRAIAHHCTEAKENFTDDCGLVEREENARAETVWPVCRPAVPPSS
jgi:hypothetical protein